MVRLLRWLSVLQFVAFPVLVVASIWFHDLKLLLISGVLLLSSAFFNAFSTVVQRQESGEL